MAVIGYTNDGKTSVIKAITCTEKLEPKVELFATSDVTSHPTVLPSQLESVMLDTVGFISDIPTSLIASFNATLEDAALADLLIHVRDVSNPGQKTSAYYFYWFDLVHRGAFCQFPFRWIYYYSKALRSTLFGERKNSCSSKSCIIRSVLQC